MSHAELSGANWPREIEISSSEEIAKAAAPQSSPYTGAQGAEPVQPVAARVAKFARSLHLANWTSALLAAYNPTGSAKVAYEDAKAALVADLTALAQPQVSREARK